MRIEPIRTERLVLRGFTKEDARFAISIWNDKDMGQYLPDESMDEITEEYLQLVENLGEDKKCCYLIAESKDTKERIGTCSFIPNEDGTVYDLAYCVHREFWRQGYATEMAKGMIDYAKSQGAKKAIIFINQENVASNKVAQKLGFAVVGEKTYLKRGTNLTFKDYKYEKEI